MTLRLASDLALGRPGTIRRASVGSPVLPRAVAYWKTVDYSGTGDLLDGSGNGHHAVPWPPVVGPTWNSGPKTFTLDGIDDYFEIADHADLDFGATDSFTVAILCSLTIPAAATQALFAKRTSATGTLAAGWLVRILSAASIPSAFIDDAAVALSRTGGTIVTATPTLLSLVRNVGEDGIRVGTDGTLSNSTADTTTATLANADVVRIGRLSGIGLNYAPMTFYGAAVFRFPLSAFQLRKLALELVTAA